MVTKGRPLRRYQEDRPLFQLPAGFFFLSASHSSSWPANPYPAKTDESRQRAFTYRPASLLRDYREEYVYIQNRREAVVNGTGTSDDLPAPPVSEIPPNLKGLACSGGGIRSATSISASWKPYPTQNPAEARLPQHGIWQFLNRRLDEGQLRRELDDVYGNLVQTPDEGKLLDPINDFVTHPKSLLRNSRIA